MAIHMGGIISPFNAWLIMRGLTTLPIRMAAHQENASLSQGTWSSTPKSPGSVPGVPSHPQHEPRPSPDEQLRVC